VTPELESIERAAAFLSSCAGADGRRSVPLRSRLQALFGSWVAKRAGVPPAVSRLDAQAALTRDALAFDSERGAFDPYAHDAKLLLLCRIAMRDCGYESEPLRAFCREVVGATRTMSVVPPRLAGVVLLLRRMGEKPTRKGARIDTEVRAPAGSLLRADAATVRDVCNGVAGSTLFGSRRLAAGDTADLASTLPVILLEKLRQYDLTLGSTVLRTLKYIRARAKEEVAYATEYLLSQQKQNGRFGYYARELAEGDGLEDADLDLYLPVTVSVLWSLVEVSIPSFRLVEQRPRRPEPGPVGLVRTTS